MAQQNFIYDGDDSNFTELVLANSDKGPVVVLFWAPYAGPSFKLYGVLETLAKEYAGKFLLININAEKQKKLARQFNIASLPTLKVFRKGEVVETMHGPQPDGDLRRMLDRFMARESDGVLVAALREYQNGHLDRCFDALAQAAMDDPDNLRIPLTLAKLLVREDRAEDAFRLLDSLPSEAKMDSEILSLHTHLEFMKVVADADSREALEQAVENQDDLKSRHQLAAVCLLEDDYEAALEHLFTILQQDREYGQDVGRRGMLAVFHMLKNEGPLVDKYRKTLFQALH